MSASPHRPSRRSTAPAIAIPPLKINYFETGGVWGLEHDLPRLPPEEAQGRGQHAQDEIHRSSSDHAGVGAVQTPEQTVATTIQRNSIPCPPPVALARQGNGLASRATAVPEVHYSPQSEDDDNTFVDHGSIVHNRTGSSLLSRNTISTRVAATALAYGAERQQSPHVAGDGGVGKGTVVCAPLAAHRLGIDARTSGEPAVGAPEPFSAHHRPPGGGGTAHVGADEVVGNGIASSPPARTEARPSLAVHALPAETAALAHPDARQAGRRGSGTVTFATTRPPLPHWPPAQLVSRMTMEQSLRDMAVAPDGATLWAAIGDDPLAMIELDGTELTVTRALHTVRQVSCMAVVRTPGTSQRTFSAFADSTPPATAKSRSAKGRRSGGGAARSPERAHRRAHRGNVGLEGAGVVVAEQGEDSYALWCGMPRGMITIVDLQRGTLDGCIANAHTDTIQRIWYLENGRVWTAGRDKALKVWDPQTRRKVKTRNIAAILVDLCYVRTTQQVWAIAGDSVIRVYDAGGDNVCVARRSPEVAENALKMRSEVTLVAYNAVTDLVWAGLGRGTVLLHPTSYEVVASVNLTLTALTFSKNTAIVTGHRTLLGSGRGECVAVLDATSRALEPAVLFVGDAMPQVQPIGMRLFTTVPLAVVAQAEQPGKRCTLSVFTYAETRPFGKLAAVAVPAREPVVVAPQRRIVVGHRLHPAPNAPVPAPPTATTTTVVQQESTKVAAPSPSPSGAVRSVSPLPPAGVDSAPREVLSSLGDLKRSGEELRGLLLNWRRAEAPLADFARVQQSLTRWLLECPDTVPPLDPDTGAAIEREYGTQEGKSMAMMIARLMQFANRVDGRRGAQEDAKETSGVAVRSPPWGLPRHAGKGHRLLAQTQSSSLPATGGGGATVDDATHADPPTPPPPLLLRESCPSGATAPPGSNDAVSLLTCMLQLSQHGQGARVAHQKELHSLQRHNERCVERNAALVHGFARLQQALRTHLQARLATTPTPLDAESLSHALDELRELHLTSSPAAVGRAVDGLLAAWSVLLRAVPSRGSAPCAAGAAASTTIAVDDDTLRRQPPTGRVAALLSCPPWRLLRTLQQAVHAVAAFAPHFTRAWGRIENMQRALADDPSDRRANAAEDGALPFLPPGVVLWDVMLTQAMQDLCRQECYLVLVETLTDARSDGCFDRVWGDAGDALRDELAAVAASVVTASIELDGCGTLVRQSLHEMRTRLVAQMTDEGTSDPCTSHSLLATRKAVAVAARGLRGLVYWAQLTTHRVADCLQYVEQLPLHQRAAGVTGVDVVTHRSNLLVLTQKLDSWLRILREMGDEMGLIALVLQHALDPHVCAGDEALVCTPRSVARDVGEAESVAQSGSLNEVDRVDSAACSPCESQRGEDDAVRTPKDGDAPLPTLLAFQLLCAAETQTPLLLLQSPEDAPDEGDVRGALNQPRRVAAMVCRRTRRLIRRTEALRVRVCEAVTMTRSPSFPSL